MSIAMVLFTPQSVFKTVAEAALLNYPYKLFLTLSRFFLPRYFYSLSVTASTNTEVVHGSMDWEEISR